MVKQEGYLDKIVTVNMREFRTILCMGIQSNVNVLIVGHSQIGKSTVITHTLNNLPDIHVVPLSLPKLKPEDLTGPLASGADLVEYKGAKIPLYGHMLADYYVDYELMPDGKRRPFVPVQTYMFLDEILKAPAETLRTVNDLMTSYQVNPALQLDFLGFVGATNPPGMEFSQHEAPPVDFCARWFWLYLSPEDEERQFYMTGSVLSKRQRAKLGLVSALDTLVNALAASGRQRALELFDRMEAKYIQSFFGYDKRMASTKSTLAAGDTARDSLKLVTGSGFSPSVVRKLVAAGDLDRLLALRDAASRSLAHIGYELYLEQGKFKRSELYDFEKKFAQIPITSTTQENLGVILASPEKVLDGFLLTTWVEMKDMCADAEHAASLDHDKFNEYISRMSGTVGTDRFVPSFEGVLGDFGFSTQQIRQLLSFATSFYRFDNPEWVDKAIGDYCRRLSFNLGDMEKVYHQYITRRVALNAMLDLYSALRDQWLAMAANEPRQMEAELAEILEPVWKLLRNRDEFFALAASPYRAINLYRFVKDLSFGRYPIPPDDERVDKISYQYRMENLAWVRVETTDFAPRAAAELRYPHNFRALLAYLDLIAGMDTPLARDTDAMRAELEAMKPGPATLAWFAMMVGECAVGRLPVGGEDGRPYYLPRPEAAGAGERVNLTVEYRHVMDVDRTTVRYFGYLPEGMRALMAMCNLVLNFVVFRR